MQHATGNFRRSKLPAAQTVATVGFLLLLSGVLETEGCKITIRNECSYKLAVCTQTTDKPPASAGPINQYDLKANSDKVLDLGNECKFPSGVVYAAPSGKCAASTGTSAATADRSQVNLMELNINAIDGPDNYDLSNKDGFAVPMQIKPSKAGCDTLTCRTDVGSVCKGDNKVINFPGGSPSKACQNTDGHSANTHSATDNTEIFKRACPDAYSYDYDDKSSLKACPHGGNFDLTFCP